MVPTLIIGEQSNLSQVLHKKIPNTHLISSRAILENTNILASYKNKEINIIFNNFHPATQFNLIDSFDSYIQNSIGVTSKILDYFNKTEIGKIIYTSSSSVYGNNQRCKETDALNPLNLHAALKVSNEKLIKEFCSTNGTEYTIARIFNMYGGNDRFSIISKIIDCARTGETFTLVNGGDAIRDFIHIDDVALAYEKILKNKTKNCVNIGTGKGVKIKSIVDIVKQNGMALKVRYLEKEELNVSISDNSLLQSIISRDTFISVEDYLNKVLG